MRKATGLFVALAAIASVAFITPKHEAKTINVVIDAGHGGKDFGMTQGDFTEKQLVRDLTQRIKILNQDQNIVLHFTRTGDTFVALEDRIAFINQVKPDLVLSLHVNGSKNIETSGVECYIPASGFSNSEKSRTIAANLQAEFEGQNLKSNGIKEASFLILKKSEAPAVTLELGYLSNAGDRQYLTDQKRRDSLAKAILKVVSQLH